MTTRDIIYIALFAAFTAALALFPPIVLPLTGVPITAQTLGPMLAGAILGARRGFLSQLLFLALVAAGLPLLAGGRGGLAVFVGPTGGFALGFAISALVIGWLCERFWARITAASLGLIVVFGGIVVLYPIGAVWIAVVAGLSYPQALAATAAFIPGDLVKAVVATAIAMTVRRSYPLMPVASARKSDSTDHARKSDA